MTKCKLKYKWILKTAIKILLLFIATLFTFYLFHPFLVVNIGRNPKLTCKKPWGISNSNDTRRSHFKVAVATHYFNSEWYCEYAECRDKTSKDLTEPYRQCVFEQDWRQADVLLFHLFDLAIIYPFLLPPLRHNTKYIQGKQLWVLVEHESPIDIFGRRRAVAAISNVFNLSVSYRRSSDIWAPYGQLTKLNAREQTRWKTDLANGLWPPPKTPGHLAIIVCKGIFHVLEIRKIPKILCNMFRVDYPVSSNCGRQQSGRWHHVYKLRQYMPVAVHGECGNKTQEKWEALVASYKFYLAFEGEICSEYISEKFWNPLRFGIVPVAIGGRSRRDYELIAPPKSFIYAADFNSFKELADYLLYLDKNDTAYIEYFRWMVDYGVKPSIRFLCPLCDRLNDWANGKTLKSATGATDIANWTPEKECVKPPKKFWM